jgi:hypothetical protein
LNDYNIIIIQSFEFVNSFFKNFGNTIFKKHSTEKGCDMRRIRLKHISFQTQMTVILPMILAVLLFIGISTVARRREMEITKTDPTTATTQTVIAAEPIRILLMIGKDAPKYLTVAQVKGANAIECMPVTVADMTEIYDKKGARGLKEAVNAAYYVQFTVDGIREMLQYYGNGVTVFLPQQVDFVDEDGLKVSFSAGENRVSSNQAAEILMYYINKEKDSIAEQMVAQMWEDAIETYIVAGRDFQQDYDALTQYADTDIRISQFSAVLPRLQNIRE